MDRRVLTTGNPKTLKGSKRNYLTGILHLLPHKYAGIGNVCPDASPGCLSTCLVFAGRGQMPKIQAQRKEKTLRFRNDRDVFMLDIAWNIKALQAKAKREGTKLAIRLNGTSDIPWENLKVANQGYTLMELFPDVQFYDYTKSFQRAWNSLFSSWPKNYHLVLSRSELNEAHCVDLLRRDIQVAVVVDKIPENPSGVTWNGFPCYSGEEDDLRFLDKPGVYLLKAKGLAKKDTSGFVLRGGLDGTKEAHAWAWDGSSGIGDSVAQRFSATANGRD